MQKFEHGGQIYNADGTTGDWLDFSADINLLGLSERVHTALIENKSAGGGIYAEI